MRLSDQAITTLMITLQKCILEQIDITKFLRGYNFQINEEDETLLISNPPTTLDMSKIDDFFENREEKSTVGSD